MDRAARPAVIIGLLALQQDRMATSLP